LIRKYQSEDTDGVHNIFPGKELLASFSKSNDIPKAPMLQNLLIKEIARDETKIPQELRTILAVIAS